MRKPSKKIFAAFFLIAMGIQTFYPGVSYALTSGPAQPEMQKFAPAGVNDMVDLFTGDFKNNIPLLDVGGYPVNIAYQSGTGVEEEASWVGTGWSLNPGAVNRNMRGLPDDFNGDQVEKTSSHKEFKKVGGQVVVKPSILAWETGSAALKMNVYKDNYYGFGASVGASISQQLAKNSKTSLTAALDLDVNSDTRNGLSISPNLTLQRENTQNSELSLGGLSGGFKYNTRSGLKSYSLGASFSSSALDRIERNNGLSLAGPGVSFEHVFGQSYTPVINNNSLNTSFTFGLDLGITFFGGHVGLGGSGYVYKEHAENGLKKVRSYGYMNYLAGRKNQDALLDFNREKDGVFLPSSPAIAVPVATHDYFTATGQTGSQQFRPHFGGNYVVFDRIHSNKSLDASGGVTLAGGNIALGGARVDVTVSNSTTKKWVRNNGYLARAEPAFPNGPVDEPVYIKQVGEHIRADQNFLNVIGKEETKQVAINDRQFSFREAIAYAAFKSRESGRTVISNDIRKAGREKRNTLFSYLNAFQATRSGLDKTIKTYSSPTSYSSFSRLGGNHKAHHISEIKVTDSEGKRMIYGIPVYNNEQQEASFSIAPPLVADMEKARRTGLVGYATNEDGPNNKGRDNYYSREKTPGYATSFLLTGILSQDYIDLKEDGITDDDLGTAVKFNYTRHTDNYQWRAPYELNKANYNEGMLSDPKDDKASYVYGKKELWYLNSIESKTMIAIFETSNREDALGVLSKDGGKNTSLKQRKLDRIKLYSKAEWLTNPSTAVPIKTVHFEYDYSLYPGVPNNSEAVVTVNDINVNAAKGKLTLKKIYFTFGTSSRGQTNPYEFEYDLRPINDGSITGLPAIVNTDLEYTDNYTQRQDDRWGTYKKSFYNQIIGGDRGLNNSEFPYTQQKDVNKPYDARKLADRFASKWQLNKITTPTGSIINIEYESDDYAYVQNRRAMQMCFLKGITTSSNTTNMATASRFVVGLPQSVSNVAEFKKKYLEGIDKVFYKILTDLDNRGHKEYVYGYASLNLNDISVSGSEATIGVSMIGGINPVTRNAWQLLRTDLPQYGYDNYDNSDVGDGEGAIRSIIQALKNFGEIVKPFDKKAKERKYGNTIDPARSMIRLLNPDGKKIGGGSRVSKITISDQWNEMSGVAGSQTATYGQTYSYKTKDLQGNEISSGVAAYEPQVGNEENPFHEPINFTEKVHWGSDKYHFIEKPFCETYFPAASVGYSKVTVTSIGTNGQSETGHIENEFYTAKDFPTLVDNMPLDFKNASNSITLTLFASVTVKHAAASQGFKVETNDMHGKQKSIKIYNKGGDMLSATEYFYNVKDENAELKELDNYVSVLEADGSVTQKNSAVPNSGVLIATDVDFTSDVRESTNESTGGSVAAYPGGMVIFIFFIPYFGLKANAQVNIDTYHAVSTVKVIHKFGVIKKIRTTQNGSTFTAENVLFDGETGEVLLTKTQNEFNDYTYAFNYPAYMAYEGMAGAYKNMGATFANFITTSNGRISSSLTSYLFPGDELVSDLIPGLRGWVIKSPQDGTLRFIDRNGEFISNNILPYRIDRSGRRNMMSAAAGSVICMNNPIVSGHIELGVDRKILDSKAALFKDEWSIPVLPGFSNYSDCNSSATEEGEEIEVAAGGNYDTLWVERSVPGGKETVDSLIPSHEARASVSCNCSCLKGLFDYLISTQQLFIQQSQSITVGQLVTAANNAGFTIGSCPVLNNNTAKLFYALTSNQTATTYSAKIGDCKISINSNTGSAVDFYTLKSDRCSGGDNVTYSAQGSGSQSFSKTFYTTCSQNSITWEGGATQIVNNAPKLIAGNYWTSPPTQQQFFINSNFQIPGISSIPSNATVNSANLYLFSYTGGFHPTAYPYAHSTNVEAGGITPFKIMYIQSPWNCISSVNGWVGGGLSTPITNHFQDVILDFRYEIQRARSYGTNNGWALRNVTPDLNMAAYATFTSENEPNVNRRPKLEVTYTVPGGVTIPNAATLQIDECIACPDPLDQKINPYFAGILGNWRAFTSYLYTVNRTQVPGLATQNGGTDIRRNGYYSDYTTFWSFVPGGGLNTAFNLNPTVPYATTDNKSRWVWNNKSVYYDQKGNEIESVDALDRYGAALFGYKQSVAVAVGANARHNEIMYDGFEDYKFDLQPGTAALCPAKRHLDFDIVKSGGTWTGQNGSVISTAQAHTGKYSYKLMGNTTIVKNAGLTQPNVPVLGTDALGRYLLKSNELVTGFSPVNGKKQLLSIWVNDETPTSNKISRLTLKINGTDYTINNIEAPVVEGWKKLDLVFTAGSTFTLELIPSGTVYIDDIRIMPFDAQLSSFVYDDANMRLMAQLDENNFATLYEYDEEGTPVRVKKETERGIMTLKESRQSFRKRQ